MSVNFNAALDFSTLQNPNGVWTYQTNGVPYTFSGTGSGYDFWAVDGTAGSAAVLFNTTGAPVPIGTVTLPPDQLGLDPGTDSDSTVRFTAPAKAYYAVTGGFAGIDTSQTPHLVGVIAAGRTFFQSSIDTYGQSASFMLVILLKAGETIDFVNSGSGVGNAATALSATVLQAATFTWNNAVGGDFDTAANWAQGAVPGVGDSVAIRKRGTYTVTSSTDHWLTRLEIRNAAATLAVTAGTFSTQQLVNRGAIVVGDGSADATLALEGKAANLGTVTVTGGRPTTLSIGAAGLVLNGGGSVVLGGSDAAITGIGGVLNNVNNVISGAGELGAGAIELLNGAAGVIEAQGGELNVSTVSTVVNSGILRAAAGSTLTISSDVRSTRGGTFEAIGTGATVVFEDVTLSGRTTLQATSGGSFAVGGGLTIVDPNFTLNGDLSIDAASNGANSALMLEGATLNTGTITVTGGDPYSGQLQICDATVQLTGGGSIVLAGVAENSGIVGTTPNSRLINRDNTIEGTGYIGEGFLGSEFRLVNQAAGTIDANVSGGTLLVDVPSMVINRGTMQATNGGTLALRGEIEAETGSVFKASGGDIVLDNLLLVGDVVMQADAGGAIVAAAGLASLEGNISFSGDVTVDALANGDDTELMLKGKVTNSGTITVTSSDDLCGCGPFGALSVCAGPVTLLGGGSVIFSGATAALFSTSPYSKLINIDNTIAGEGFIGDGFLPIVNQVGGTIDANVDGRTMWLTTGYGSSNGGTIQASNGAALEMQGVLRFGYTGVLKTVGATSSVVLNGAALVDARLDASGGGAIAVKTAVLQGNTRISGALTVDAAANACDAALLLSGTVTNQGVVTLVGGIDVGDPLTSYSAQLLVTKTFFQGGGSYVLSGVPEATMIGGFDVSARLTNVDSTIEGAGLIGDLMLVNQANGVIDANVSGETLLVGTGSSAVVNQGTLQASDGGHLVMASAVAERGFGVVDGGTLEFQSSVNIAVSFTANGGTLEVDNSDVFRGSVAGFGDDNPSQMVFSDIDFATVAGSFKRNGIHTGGTLRVSDGVDTAQLTLLGQYANNFTTAPGTGYVGFVLSDDGTANHGTLVTYMGA
jgi:hypothetical protein